MEKDPTAIKHFSGGTLLTGDAVTLHRYGVLFQAVKVFHNTGMLLTRDGTMKVVLPQIAQICGKAKYTNNAKGRLEAMADLRKTIDVLRGAIPHEDVTS